MTQFAGVRPFSGWESYFPNAHEDMMQGEFIVLSTEKIEEEIILQLRKKKHLFYCLQCGKTLRFRREHMRNGAPIHAHFYHQDQECSPSESPVHALTKGFLFNLLKERGYTVTQSYNHRDTNGRRVRADVAMLENELKLVVEVQASHGQVADAKRKMAVYGTDHVPVAWVLLLDRFFRDYAIVDPRLTGDNRMIIGREGKYTVHHPLETTMNYMLVLGGKDHALFDFLIDEYLYVIGIIANGNVLLIRRTPKKAAERERARALGEAWSTTNDEYDVTLIPEQRIVDVLLDTPLIETEYEGKNPSVHKSADKFKGKDCQEEEKSRSVHSPFLIDFEQGKVTEEAQDPLALIRETREAAHRERKQIELEKKREEMLKKQELERKRREELERKRREEALRKQQQEEAERKRREQEKQREEAERQRLLAKQKEEQQRQALRKQNLRESKQEIIERVLFGEDEGIATPIVDGIRNKLFEQYESLPKSKRLDWEKKTFKGRYLPVWFFSRKSALEEREHKEKKEIARLIKKYGLTTPQSVLKHLYSQSHTQKIRTELKSLYHLLIKQEREETK